jgi:hypothetical protein
MSDNRQHAHQLIDRLPEWQLSALVGLLETIVDPVAVALADAPVDDEEETDEERAAPAQARHSLQRNGGKGVPHAEAMRRLGLPSIHTKPLAEP